MAEIKLVLISLSIQWLYITEKLEQYSFLNANWLGGWGWVHPHLMLSECCSITTETVELKHARFLHLLFVNVLM